MTHDAGLSWVVAIWVIWYVSNTTRAKSKRLETTYVCLRIETEGMSLLAVALLSEMILVSTRWCSGLPQLSGCSP